MKNRDIKTLVNKILKDLKNGIKHKEIEQIYNIEIDYIEDFFYFRLEKFYEGKIEGLKKKDYKIIDEIYFNFQEDLSEIWVEIKIYNYIEHAFEYITVFEQ